MATGLPTGMGARLGIATQTDYATIATVSKFYEFNNESIKAETVTVESRGFRGGSRFLRADRVDRIVTGAGGDFNFDVMNKGFSTWMKHMFGQNTITGSGAAKTHTALYDALVQQGKALTAQIIRPRTDGNLDAYTYPGGKIRKWQLVAALDKPLVCIPTLDFSDEKLDVSIASPTYPTTKPFHFKHAALTLNSTTVYANSAKLTSDPKLSARRRSLGNVNRENLPTDLSDLMIDLDFDYDVQTWISAQRAGTQYAFVLAFTHPDIIPTTATPFSLTITVPCIEVATANANVANAGKLAAPVSLRALDNGTDPVASCVYVTSDTTD